ncbi:hypothetical protein ACFXPI_02225 [Streptomyces sp. NPDC059104]|uniref:hypothetical protein n=1 Tax=Streptomyces sp. NPDC059104 TaxID=3346729 RepID=UPI00369A5647
MLESKRPGGIAPVTRVLAEGATTVRPLPVTGDISRSGPSRGLAAGDYWFDDTHADATRHDGAGNRVP